MQNIEIYYNHRNQMFFLKNDTQIIRKLHRKVNIPNIFFIRLLFILGTRPLSLKLIWVKILIENTTNRLKIKSVHVWSNKIILKDNMKIKIFFENFFIESLAFWKRANVIKHPCILYVLQKIGLFVCVYTSHFSLIWTRYHYWLRVLNFDLYSALMATEQWGLFNVSHPLWDD